jgi:para-aminobenzoate synthetase component I
MTRFILPYQKEKGKWLIADGIESHFFCYAATHADWDAFQIWIDQHPEYRFGWISYESGNTFENIQLETDNRDSFPQLFFFTPINLILTNGRVYEVLKGEFKSEYLEWVQMETFTVPENITLNPETTRTDYLNDVSALQSHIQAGDIYEVNYCIKLFAQATLENPLDVWKKLYSLTEPPHAAFAEHNQWHVLCASPERFINKNNKRICSQPIKGTIKRGKNAEEDDELKESLYNNKKERSENVMIVDLVRNDLSRFAAKGSVEVCELFGIQSFKTVHHLVSTVCCEMKEGVSFVEIMKATFPMGSMTGAPKRRAMELIRQVEKSVRGVYSGSIGYMTPEGDFDFNVVIRSILYNSELQEISAGVGSAITANCIPEKEYDECMLKAAALIKAIGI